MAFAETAKLAVNLSLEGNFTSGITAAEGKLAGLNATASRGVGSTGILSGAMGRLGVVATGVGGALSHAGGQLKGLLTGPLGFLGLTGGLLSVGGAIGASVGKIEEFGASLEKVQTLTGETAIKAGALIIQFQKFGLGADRIAQIVGFTEKTIGKLNETAGSTGTKLQELDAKFGLSLVDSKGKVADFSTILGQLATFYDSNASASTKAFVASQVFGRGYTAMIPILNEGSAGLRAAAQEAASLGLNSQTSVDQIAKFHDMMHALGEQVNTLQLRIGMALIPVMSSLVSTIQNWLNGGGADQIVGFFKSAGTFAQEMGHAIQTWVVPAFGKIADAWGMVPGPLKDILIGGFVAQKGSKWLFGSGPIDWIKSLVGLGAKKLPVVGGLLGGIGVQHVWVDNLGPGGLNPTNLLGPAEQAGGGLVASLAASAAGLVAILGAPLVATYFAEHGMFGFKPGGLPPRSPDQPGGSAGGTRGGFTNARAQWLALHPEDATPAEKGGRVYTPDMSLENRDAAYRASTAGIFGAHEVGFGGRNNLAIFRGSAQGAIDNFGARLRYLSGAQGSGAGTPGYLALVGRDIAALKRDMVGATTSQKAKLSADIEVLQGILKAKKFNLSPESAAALVNPLKGKQADDLTLPLSKAIPKDLTKQADTRETNRITRVTGATTASKIDFAKVYTGKRIDDTTSAVEASQAAIVSAIHALATAFHVTISTSTIQRKSTAVHAWTNPTTSNRGGAVAS